MKYSRDDLIKYRLSRSRESFEEARILAESNHWNTVANRLYYALFYSIIALFIRDNIQSSTHSAVKSNFHKRYIKTGILEKDYGRLFNDLFNKRQEGDYQDFHFFEQNTIEPLFSKVEEFINKMNELIYKVNSN
jgi:uncharacterized protein